MDDQRVEIAEIWEVFLHFFQRLLCVLQKRDSVFFQVGRINHPATHKDSRAVWIAWGRKRKRIDFVHARQVEPFCGRAREGDF